MSPEKIIMTLKEYFGSESIPCPRNYPQSFMFYVELYSYLKKKK